MKEQVIELWAVPGVRVAVIAVGSLLASFLVAFVIRRTVQVMVRKTKTTLDDEVLAATQRPIFLSVLLYGLSWTAGEIPMPASAIALVIHVLQTLAILVWSAAAFRVGHVLLSAWSEKGSETSIVQPRTLPVFDMMIKIAVAGGSIYFAFLVWDIDLTAWMASAGILGIAVGFAAKDTLANLFSGIFIVADAPYKIGDWIVIEDELRGEVTKIGIRSTRVLTRDDIEITIPNAVIGNSKIINEAGGPHVKQRVPCSVNVAYGSDVDQVREVLMGCAVDLRGIATTPSPEVRFREFGGSGLRFELLVWILKPSERGLIIDRVNTRIYKAFAANHIEIPYSKHDVYIKSMPAPAPAPASARDSAA